MKRCRYSGCRKPFEPKRSSLEDCCSSPCALAYVRESAPDRLERQRKRALVAERSEHRKERQLFRTRTMSISKLKQGADREFGRFIRERDFNDPCICCDSHPSAQAVATLAVNGHLWDAGHWRSKGAADHLRYNEDNCHKQLVSCNRDKSGDSGQYRARLIQKIGLELVEALENDNGTHKWTRDELVQIRRKYLAKWKDLKAAREARAVA